MKRVAGMGWIGALALGLALLFGGCTATSSSAGGGDDGEGNETGGQDPLPEYQLGMDEQLDANVAAIVDATEQAHACLEQNRRPEKSDVLLVLKQEFVANPGLAETFEEFVADNVELEQARTDEICNTTLENASENLLELVSRLTDAGIRSAQCAGEDPDADNAESLKAIKGEYLGEPAFAFESMTDFADAFVQAAEDSADAECSP